MIVGLILRLSPSHGKGGFVPRDGSREVIRDLRGMVLYPVDKGVGKPAWGLLVPARAVTGRDLPKPRTTSEYDHPS